MKIFEKYNRFLSKRGYSGSLDVHQQLDIGHIVSLDSEHGFSVIGDVRDFFSQENFVPKVVQSTGTADMDFTDQKGTKIQVKLQGQAVIPGSSLGVDDCGFAVTFAKAGSFVLKTKGTTVTHMQNVIELSRLIRDLYEKDKTKWHKSWLIITELVRAENAVVLVSNSRNAQVDIKAKVAVPGLSEDDLLSGAVDFSISGGSEMETSVVGKKGPFFPLFVTSKLKTVSFFRSIRNELGITPTSRGIMLGKTTAQDFLEREEKELVFGTYNFAQALDDED